MTHQAENKKAVACTMSGIQKSFGSNQVLCDINVTIPSGRITVLMGTNGAGKSTLVKLLCGVHAPDAGSMTLFGTDFAPLSPFHAQEQGVVTVHQSINDGVAPDLDVASNLLLDRMAGGAMGVLLNRRSMHEQARSIAASIGLEVDVAAQVGDLGLADRQMLAIARAMTGSPKVLILDEPTSSLSAAEAERLFVFLDGLRDTGVAILYISHRMSDVRRVADRIVAMRDGTISGMFEDTPLDYEGAVTAMLGQSLSEVHVNIAEPGDPALVFEAVQIAEASPPLDLVFHRNQVVAITGLLGSGKSELAAMLFGLVQPASGRMLLDGSAYNPTSPQQAVASGVFMCPKDRASKAVIQDFDIAGNMVLPFLHKHSRAAFLRSGRIAEVADRMIQSLGIVCGSRADAIDSLSGGNQQKVMVARWLTEECKILVLDEPFQGVDIKARHDIGAFIRKSATNRATLVFVSEVDEALEIADHILVLHEHALVYHQPNRDIDMVALMAAYSGGVAPATLNPRNSLTEVAHL